MPSLTDKYEEISQRLSKYYATSEIEDWWNLPHPQLDNIPAITVLSGGDYKSVEAIIDRLDSDAYL